MSHAECQRPFPFTHDGLGVRQMSAPVKWMQSMERMLAEETDLFIEIGPGGTLAKFMKKIAPEAKVLNVSAFEDIEKVVKAIKGDAPEA